MKSIHPAADFFPMLGDTDLTALAEDIRQNGLREPITLHPGGSILDGRNRYRACEQAGVEPHFEQWDQQGTVDAYVISKNLRRRHLNESQRAMIAAKTVHLRHGGQRGDRNQGADLPLGSVTATDAGEMLNVSTSTIKNAKTDLHEGAQEEIAAVENGDAAVSTLAVQIRAGIPKEQRGKKGPLRDVGKNPERIQRQRLNAEIWGRVRDTITHLTSLPLPSDVVDIVRAHDRTDLVDTNISAAIEWLKEFENEWNKRREDAA